jgi:hypothetical protein
LANGAAVFNQYSQAAANLNAVTEQSVREQNALADSLARIKTEADSSEIALGKVNDRIRTRKELEEGRLKLEADLAKLQIEADPNLTDREKIERTHAIDRASGKQIGELDIKAKAQQFAATDAALRTAKDVEQKAREALPDAKAQMDAAGKRKAGFDVNTARDLEALAKERAQLIEGNPGAGIKSMVELEEDTQPVDAATEKLMGMNLFGKLSLARGRAKAEKSDKELMERRSRIGEIDAAKNRLATQGVEVDSTVAMSKEEYDRISGRASAAGKSVRGLADERAKQLYDLESTINYEHGVPGPRVLWNAESSRPDKVQQFSGPRSSGGLYSLTGSETTSPGIPGNQELRDLALEAKKNVDILRDFESKQKEEHQAQRELFEKITRNSVQHTEWLRQQVNHHQ